MEQAIIFAIGMMIGIIVATIIYGPKPKWYPSGTLRIDSSDPDGPYLFLELNESIRSVSSKKQVILDVNTESYISQ